MSSDGGAITNLKTGQVNENCSPGDGGLSGGNLSFTGSIPINVDGSFKIDDTLQSEIGIGDHSDPDTAHVVITGQFSGATASGTFIETDEFTDQGTAYSCTSHAQTWTAAKTG